MVKCRLGLDPPEDRGLHWLSPSPGCLRASPSHGALHGVCPAEQPDFLQCPKAPRRKHFQKQEAAAASLLRGWVQTPHCMTPSVFGGLIQVWAGLHLLHKRVRAGRYGSRGLPSESSCHTTVVPLVTLCQRLLVPHLAAASPSLARPSQAWCCLRSSRPGPPSRLLQFGV